MFLFRFIKAVWFCLSLSTLLMSLADAQFGMDGHHQQGGGLDHLNMDDDDPELLAAMEIFASMTPEEMEETMIGLQEMLGDDPETLEAMKEIMEELKNMDPSDLQNPLRQLLAEDEVARATEDALEMIGGSSWEEIWEKQQAILEAVVQSGKISEEDVALFTSDQDAWEKELRFIWNDLQRQVTHQEL